SAVSMEAHYREFANDRNRKVAKKRLTAAFPSKTPPYTFLRTDLSTMIRKSENVRALRKRFR
ncbi:hypothetical protein, partial [Enterobacter roggenkampii]|uniref:hypothetical protein n=1 Tax=Enterobacter roggenkampii TaxID=1812935 RepID=UPI002A829E66